MILELQHIYKNYDQDKLVVPGDAYNGIAVRSSAV